MDAVKACGEVDDCAPRAETAGDGRQRVGERETRLLAQARRQRQAEAAELFESSGDFVRSQFGFVAVRHTQLERDWPTEPFRGQLGESGVPVVQRVERAGEQDRGPRGTGAKDSVPLLTDPGDLVIDESLERIGHIRSVHHKGTKITQRYTEKSGLSFVFLCVIFVPLW